VGTLDWNPGGTVFESRLRELPLEYGLLQFSSFPSGKYLDKAIKASDNILPYPFEFIVYRTIVLSRCSSYVATGEHLSTKFEQLNGE
jgi:hypothetical protein